MWGSVVEGPNVYFTRGTNGEVVVIFIGILQSALNLDGGFLNVPGNPTSPYTIPSSNLVTRQFFRASQ